MVLLKMLVCENVQEEDYNTRVRDHARFKQGQPSALSYGWHAIATVAIIAKGETHETRYARPSKPPVKHSPVTHDDEIGSQGVVSEILRGKRELNIRQIRALSKRFHVSPGVFI